MTDRKMSLEQVGNLLKKADFKERAEGPKIKWPSELGLRALAKAVRRREHEVQIDGQLFRITYDKDSVRVNPVGENFAPMGWFEYGKLDAALVTAVH